MTLLQAWRIAAENQTKLKALDPALENLDPALYQYSSEALEARK
jgi:hypothetical protein